MLWKKLIDLHNFRVVLFPLFSVTCRQNTFCNSESTRSCEPDAVVIHHCACARNSSRRRTSWHEEFCIFRTNWTHYILQKIKKCSRHHTNITAFELRRTPCRPPRQHNARFWDGREASAAREGRWAMESRVTVSARWSARLSAELIRLYLTARFAVIPAFFAYSPQTVPVLFQGQRRGWWMGSVGASILSQHAHCGCGKK